MRRFRFVLGVFLLVAGQCVSAQDAATGTLDLEHISWQPSAEFPAETNIDHVLLLLQGKMAGPCDSNRNIRAGFLLYLLANPAAPYQGINITNAIVVDSLDLKNMQIDPSFALEGCDLNQKADFSSTHFLKSVSFARTVFHEPAVFDDTRIDGDLDLSKAAFCSNADFTHVQIAADLNCGGAWFANGAAFTGFKVGHSVSLDSVAEFSFPVTNGLTTNSRAAVAEQFLTNGEALSNDFELRSENLQAGRLQLLDGKRNRAYSLWSSSGMGTNSITVTVLRETYFGSNVDISGASVANKLTAWGADFHGGALFDTLKVEDSADLDWAIFDGDVSWGFAVINNQFSVSNVQFNSTGSVVNFYSLRCGEAVLQGADFAGGVDFGNATVTGDLMAYGCAFGSNGVADFLAMKVKGSADLSGATFAGPARFMLVQIGGNMNFSSAHFTDTRSPKDLRVVANGRRSFTANADFGSMNVDGSAFFSNAHFKNIVSFQNANIRNLYLNKIEWQTNIDGATNLVRFEGLNYKRIQATRQESSTPGDSDFVDSWTNINWVLTNRSIYAVDVYSELEAYLAQEGYSDLADDVFLEGKTQERQTFPSYSGERWLNGFLYYTVGFGRRPLWAAGWSALIILIGVIVFVPCMKRKGHPRQRLLDQIVGGFWYTIDLFLPIIDLKTYDLWEPRPGREKVIWLGYVYKILGFILIPLWAAALAGLMT
jgi:hypothetical protein